MKTETYHSKELVWDRHATLRRAQRRVLPEGEIVGFMFPQPAQPLCTDPRVTAMGEDVKRVILLQTAYKYMSDISFVETDCINDVSLRLAHGRDPFDLPADLRYDALTIIADETYHAYVAADFVRQVSTRTGIEPLPNPQITELSKVMKLGRGRLPEELHPAFDLLAVGIGENILTQELLTLTGSPEVNSYLHELVTDHVQDEGRHCVFFAQVIELVWRQLSDSGFAVFLPIGKWPERAGSTS